MTAAEFKNEFNIAYNNIMSGAAAPLDDYEISVFLTKAQEEIVLSLYSGRPSGILQIEQQEETRRYLNDLIKREKITITLDPNIKYNGFDIYVALRPSSLWFILNEKVTNDITSGCYKGNDMIVVPLRLDDIDRITKNPFKRPNNKKAYRLDITDTVNPHEIEILTSVPIKDYTVVYLKKPSPIIVSLLTSLTIDGLSAASTTFDLPTSLHRKIVIRAAEIAKSMYQGDLAQVVQLNSRNQ